MKKLTLVLAVIVVLAIFVYYTGVYTYFISREISEDMPESVIKTETEIRVIKQGQFIDADFFHKGSGEAKIISYADGKNILRFENFDITNGPDLFVYLSESTTPGKNLENLGNFLDLGMLKGNKGNQNYDLPAQIDLEKYKSVVIWCKQFGVLFPYTIFK